MEAQEAIIDFDQVDSTRVHENGRIVLLSPVRKWTVEEEGVSDEEKQMETDDSLISRAQKGDERAFTELVDRYQNKVYGTALRMLRDQDDALETAQEVFLRVWKHLHTLKKGQTFRSWLYRITTNYALDQLRRRRFAQPISLQEEGANLLEVDFQTKPLNPRQIYAQHELKERVEKAMEELPPQQKTVFVLRHYQSLQLSEIAEVLGISLGTVKATLHAALEKIRTKLAEKKRSGIERRSGS